MKAMKGLIGAVALACAAASAQAGDIQDRLHDDADRALGGARPAPARRLPARRATGKSRISSAPSMWRSSSPTTN